MSDIRNPIEFASAVQRHSRAVARLAIRGEDGTRLGYSTGFLVAPGILVSCHHVLQTPEDAARTELSFDFYQGDDGRISSPYIVRLRPETLFITDVEADLAIVAISSKKDLADRTYNISSVLQPPVPGESIIVLHHGSAEPLKASMGEIIRASDGKIIHHTASTGPGLSGAPVFDSQWNLIGIHHAAVSPTWHHHDSNIKVGEAIGLPLLVPLLESITSKEIVSTKFGRPIDDDEVVNISPTIPLRDERVVRDSVFISYAHDDQEYENWKDRLLRQLSSIPSIEQAKIWDDSRIDVGENWLEEIEFALKRTRLAILLIGPHFLTSKFVLTKELPEILEAAENDGARILPLITDFAAYNRSALGKFQSFNDPNEPLESLERSEQNRLLLAMAEKVADILNEFAD